MKYAILQETVYGGVTVENWVVDCHDGRSTKMTSANRPAPMDFLYDSLEQAEVDMEAFRVRDQDSNIAVKSKFNIVGLADAEEAA